MDLIQNSLIWNDINKENIISFMPPIYFGKVSNIHSGDCINIITKIPYLHETINTAPTYKFMLNLYGISAPKVLNLVNVNNESGVISKNALSNLILNNIIEISCKNIDRNGKINAIIYYNKININNWMIKNNYAVVCKNGNKRRNSESDENNEKNKLHLPSINNFKKIEINRPNSNSSSSIIETDCFLSHNWGKNNENHEKVKIINEFLCKKGIKTWFDEKTINGNIRFKMAEGIDNTKCFIVFITKEYREKVNGKDMKDNCKYEFCYAMNQLGSQNMIPIIMEEEMKDTSNWKGELGAALANILYIDFSDNTKIEKKYDEIYKRIKYVVNKRIK